METIISTTLDTSLEGNTLQEIAERYPSTHLQIGDAPLLGTINQLFYGRPNSAIIIVDPLAQQICLDLKQTIYSGNTHQIPGIIQKAKCFSKGEVPNDILDQVCELIRDITDFNPEILDRIFRDTFLFDGFYEQIQGVKFETITCNFPHPVSMPIIPIIEYAKLNLKRGGQLIVRTENEDMMIEMGSKFQGFKHSQQSPFDIHNSSLVLLDNNRRFQPNYIPLSLYDMRCKDRLICELCLTKS